MTRKRTPNASTLRGRAAADQENARVRDEREAAPDGMTASERAMTESEAAVAEAAAFCEREKAVRRRCDAETHLPTPTDPTTHALVDALETAAEGTTAGSALRHLLNAAAVKICLLDHILDERQETIDALTAAPAGPSADTLRTLRSVASFARHLAARELSPDVINWEKVAADADAALAELTPKQ